MQKLFILLLSFVTSSLVAQNNILALKINNKIKPDIEKVAKNYYTHFDDIKGEKISESTNTIEYESKVIPRGATESIIVQIKGLQNVY
ncbi:MAG: hypothetical protein M3R50_12935, partial [Bacteroidota bacterium]|nr:hypothetical protein [Bacteroidota bacterium]